MGQHLFNGDRLAKTVFPKIVGQVKLGHASLGDLPGQQVWADAGHPFHGLFSLDLSIFERSLQQKKCTGSSGQTGKQKQDHE
jgi:hypothetical protein